MRQIFRRTITILTGFGVAALLALAPAAAAQSTETTEVRDSGETVVTNTLITDNGDSTVVTETVTSADGCSQDVTTTTTALVTNTDPVIPSVEYEVREESAAVVRPSQVTSVTESSSALPCDDPNATGTGDEVLGEVVLAVTGLDIDLPIAIGAGLIGAGGLLVVASKRRRSSPTD